MTRESSSEESRSGAKRPSHLLGRHVLWRLVEWSGLVLVALPVVGLLLGGILFFPIERATRGRDPHLTIALTIALALPTLALGSLLRIPGAWMVAEWLMLAGALLARRTLGTLSGNVERFGLVHALVIPLNFGAAAYVHAVNAR